MKTKLIASTIAILTVAIMSALLVRAQPPDDHDAPDTHDAHDEHDHDAHVDEVKLTPDAIERYGIKIGVVTKQQLLRTLNVPARVSFDTEAMAHVGSAVSGRATEIKVRVGQDVKKGDELIIVESPELGEAQSDFLQKRTAVVVAGSAVEPARASAERARKLHEQSQGIAPAEVQKREAELKAAEGALQTAQGAAVAAENKLHLLGMDQAATDALIKSTEISPRLAIRAPIDGQVIEREITLGELVSPEKEALLILAHVDTLWAIADVPESRLKEIQIGAPAHVRVNAISSSDLIAGTVSFIGPSIDASSRTAQVRIALPNKDRKLKSGMFATAEITSASQDPLAAPMLAVPNEAVQTVEGAPAVFVPVDGEPNTFAKRAISIGTPVGALIPVNSGLKEGEKFVVSGSFILKAELGKSGASHGH